VFPLLSNEDDAARLSVPPVFWMRLRDYMAFFFFTFTDTGTLVWKRSTLLSFC